MTFPTSSTFVAANVLTAAQLNAVRADLNSINGYVAKTADQSVTSSTVLVNDTHLLYTIGATGTYVIDLFLIGTSAANAAGDLGIAFTFPTGTLNLWEFAPDIGLASGTVQTGNWNVVTATSGTLAMTMGLSTGSVAIHVHGNFVATATGTLRLQWAQQASNASASTLKAGSHMLVRQVA